MTCQQGILFQFRSLEMSRFRRQLTTWTQPSTPHHRRQRNLSFSPRDTSTSPPSRSFHPRVIQTQTSFAVDEPISDEGSWELPQRGVRYSTNLRKRLCDTRPSSMDDPSLESPFHPFSVPVSTRKNPLVSRAISFDETRYDDAQGTSREITN